MKHTFQVSAVTVSNQTISMESDDEHGQVRMPQGVLYQVSVDQGDIEYSKDGFSVRLDDSRHEVTVLTIVY